MIENFLNPCFLRGVGVGRRQDGRRRLLAQHRGGALRMAGGAELDELDIFLRRPTCSRAFKI